MPHHLLAAWLVLVFASFCDALVLRSIEQNASESNSIGANASASVGLSKGYVGDFAAYLQVNPSNPSGSVVFLVGWGAEEGWLENRLKGDFHTLANLNCRVVEAVGRHFEGQIERSWYGYVDWHNEVPKIPDLRNAVGYVHALIRQEVAVVGDYRKIILVGYSQGAVLALEAGFMFPQPIGLVFSMRGIVLKSRMQDERQGLAAKGIPFILTGGLSDTAYTSFDVASSCRYVDDRHSPAFRKFFPIDHLEYSSDESNLAFRLIAAALSHSPSQAVVEFSSHADRCDDQIY